MELFQYLQSRYPPLTPQNCKIHLASTNEYKENPITEFVNKTFDSWQCLQKHKSFDRTYVVSLIQTEDKERFLYAGTYIKKGCSLTASHYVPGRNETYNLYQLTPVTELDEYRGRMYVRTARPGYKNVVLDRVSLGAIIRQELKSWKTALSIVKGIYLLTDVDGEKLYVGQANGKDGIWGRWKTYFTTGHGGNAGLIEAFGTCDEERLKNVTFSILEIMDNNSDKHEINRREKHWKSILLSRSIGHNRN